MEYSIGIDLGTTFSAVAYIDENGKPAMIRNREGSTTTPSVIYFDNGEPVIGEEAKERQAFGETEVASFFKRSMGDEEFVEFFNDQTYTATELSAIMLKRLKEMAEDELMASVTEAVITVPAYFENKQREETIKAGRLAGLTVTAIINEPTAAALAYGIDKTKDQVIVVYDLGGGTFDVTVVEVSNKKIKVLATGGDHALGGKDWDDRIVSYAAELFEAEYGFDPLDSLDTMNDLLVKGEQVKKTLTAREKTTISVVSKGLKGTYEISRNWFEETTDDLLERTGSLTEQTLQEANLSWRHVSDVLLVGGSTRMPMVHRYVEDTIGKPPLKGVNPDEAVALGAAIKANLANVTTDNKPKVFSLAGKKEVVDVMSHSLGMVVVNEQKTKYVNSTILPKNEAIPITKKKAYQLKTVKNRKNSLEVFVTQGESIRPYECSIIGKYRVDEVDHYPDSVAELEVSYSYDANGVIHVEAKDRNTGNRLPVTREKTPNDLSWLYEAPKEEEIEVKANLSALIAIDLSGSMDGTPLQKAKQSAIEFINKMDSSSSSIGLVGFADKSALTEPITDDFYQLLDGVEKYSTLFEQAKLGYGNNAEPFTLARETLSNEEGKKFLVVLTDGYWAYQEQAIKKAKECHKEGIEIIAVGFGTADQHFLKEIATTSENALFTDLTELVSSFSKIAQEISKTKTDDKSNKTGLLRIFK